MMPNAFRDHAMAVLRYEPDTGHFYWRARTSDKMRSDLLAGSFGDQGYWRIIINGRNCRAHRLAWLFQTGDWPAKGYELDHINGERGDNRWANLRLATRTQNNMNLGLKANNYSGQHGVTWRKDTSKWHARITVDRKIILLGDYDNKDHAIAARLRAERIHFGEYAVRDKARIAVPRRETPSTQGVST